MDSIINLSRMYRLPFSKNDNFNGWIEITTCCNLKCPGCYRGCDRDGHVGGHKSLAEIKAEVLELKRVRNPSMISVSGGEPTLHPELDGIVAFVRQNRMNPVLFTNGTLLNLKRLQELKKSGLVGVVIRTDTLQTEHTGKTEAELNSVRESLSALCFKAGLFLTFTSCIDSSNLSQVKDIVNWAALNYRKAGQLILILKRQLVLNAAELLPPDGFVFIEGFAEKLISDVKGFRLAAYLGSQAETLKPKWLQAFRFVLAKKVLGYADPKFVELLQITHHYFTGSYLGILEKKKNFLGLPALLFLGFINKSLRRVAGVFLLECLKNPLNLFRKAGIQAITIVSPPHFVDGERDLCDACPDAIFYKGRLVPSCSLEEIKIFDQPFKL